MFKRADLKLGYNCNCNCTFCVVGDKLFSGDRPYDDVIKDMEDARATCDGIVFTGGEPTMRADFLDLVAHAKKVGFKSIQIQTNGRMLAYMDFCVKCVRAGANEFSPAIHGHTSRLHDSLVRTPGAFKQIYQAIVNLRMLKQTVITNTVVVKQNAKHLPDIAKMLVKLNVNQYQMAYVHAMGYVPRYFERVVPRVSEVRHYIHEAMEIGSEAGIKCMAEAVPYCHMEGFEKFVTELYIPRTEIHFGEYTVEDYKSDRKARGKKRFPQCVECKWEHICEGPWYEYPEKYGDSEFIPIQGPKIYDERLVIENKHHQIGQPAQGFTLPNAAGEQVSLSDYAGKQVLVYFYPEDNSPECTAEACNLRDNFSKLASKGLEIVGISPDSPESHKAFAEQHNLAFPLLSDENNEVSRKYGVVEHGRFRRMSFLIGPDGDLQHIFLDVNAHDHASQILNIAAFARFHEENADSPANSVA